MKLHKWSDIKRSTRELARCARVSERAAEKQASRDDDAEALRAGTKTVGQLRRENSFTAVVKFAPTDYTKVPRARIR